MTCDLCKKEIVGMAQHVTIKVTVEDLISEYDTPLNKTERYHVPCYGKKFKVKVENKS